MLNVFMHSSSWAFDVIQTRLTCAQELMQLDICGLQYKVIWNNVNRSSWYFSVQPVKVSHLKLSIAQEASWLPQSGRTSVGEAC